MKTETIKLITKNSLFGLESHEIIVNVTRRQMRGILFLFTIDTERFNYASENQISENSETPETLWEKFFIHIFKNKDLVLHRLNGDLTR